MLSVTQAFLPAAGKAVFQIPKIMMLIAGHTTEPTSLLSLLQVCEAQGHILDHWPLLPLVDAILDTLPSEFRQIAVAILALHGKDIQDSDRRTRFIETYLGHTDDEPLPEFLELHTAFVQLRTVVQAVETFTPLYVQACMQKLDHIEAVRVHGPKNICPEHGILSVGVRIMPRPYRYHWRWAGDYRITEREEYPDINPRW